MSEGYGERKAWLGQGLPRAAGHPVSQAEFELDLKTE